VGRHVTPLISEALRWQNTTELSPSKMANPRIRPLFQCTRGIEGVAFDERPYQRGYCTVVNPVYKGHSRLNLYALFINESVPIVAMNLKTNFYSYLTKI
jgi:hypothetical protein